MRTSLIIALFALPFGCAHQQAAVETAQAPPPAVQPPQIAQKQQQEKAQIAEDLGAKQPETPATAQAPQVASKEAPPPPAGAQPTAEANASPGVTCGLARVHFKFDSAELEPDGKATLDQMAGCLQQNERLRVRLEGNTDERGSREYNEQLGEKRAQAVLGYLEQRGVSSQQLNAVSFGENKPLCLGKNEGCWSLNRRTAVRPVCRL